jgi:CRP-like cAMP-binding protein
VLQSSLPGQKGYEQLIIVRQGEGVGELALISKKPRAASVLCREECHFAVLSRENYTRILARAHEELLQEKIDLLSLHPVFGKWTSNALRRLSYLFKVKSLRRKQQLFQTGSPVSEVFIIKKGDFHLATEMQSPRASTKHYNVEVSVVSKGEVLGVEDMLQDRVYAYTCVCVSSIAQVMVISKEDFLKSLGEESLNYFLYLGKAKEVYRSARLAAALRIQEERETAVQSPISRPICPSLRSKLMSERIKSLQLRPSHNHTLSWPLSPQEPCHVHNPSWCSSLQQTRSSKVLSPVRRRVA